MNDDERDPFVDELLEASLKHYGSEEPRLGLETRILGEVRARERAAALRWLGWVMAACTGVLATIVLTLHFARGPLRQLAPRAAPPPPVTAHPAPPRVPQQRLRSGPREPTVRVRGVAERHPRPKQFPTPSPLTEQEKLLLAYTRKTGKAGPVPATEISTGGLEIPSIVVAALQIKPLDESQSEQGK